MKKVYISLCFMFVSAAVQGMEDACSVRMGRRQFSVIPEASYCVFEEADECTGSIPAHSRMVLFYSAHGKLLGQERHRFEFEYMYQRLDPKAAKPRVAKCQRKYWCGLPKSYALRADPGFFLIFYDKNGHAIKSYRVGEASMRRIQSELDLTDVVVGESEL